MSWCGLMFERWQSLHIESSVWQKVTGISGLSLLKVFTFTYLLIKIIENKYWGECGELAYVTDGNIK